MVVFGERHLCLVNFSVLHYICIGFWIVEDFGSLERERERERDLKFLYKILFIHIYIYITYSSTSVRVIDINQSDI